MTCFEEYSEPIRIAGRVLDEGLQAYRMDSAENNKEMRIDVGLDTCSCCDYFLLRN